MDVEGGAMRCVTRWWLRAALGMTVREVRRAATLANTSLASRPPRSSPRKVALRARPLLRRRTGIPGSVGVVCAGTGCTLEPDEVLGRLG